jgi:hypothetical protein
MRIGLLPLIASLALGCGAQVSLAAMEWRASYSVFVSDLQSDFADVHVDWCTPDRPCHGLVDGRDAATLRFDQWGHRAFSGASPGWLRGEAYAASGRR